MKAGQASPASMQAGSLIEAFWRAGSVLTADIDIVRR